MGKLGLNVANIFNASYFDMRTVRENGAGTIETVFMPEHVCLFGATAVDIFESFTPVTRVRGTGFT